jgi:hypothetical protein
LNTDKFECIHSIDIGEVVNIICFKNQADNIELVVFTSNMQQGSNVIFFENKITV